MEKTRVYVTLSAIGDVFNPAVITDELDIVPSRSVQKGEIGKLHLEYKQTAWEKTTDIFESDDIMDQLQLVYDMFNPKVSVLKRLKEEGGIQYWIVIVIEVEGDFFPGMVLPVWFLDFAHQLEATIEFCMYHYS